MGAPGYPVTLNVETMPCLIVGGGPVAARKAAELAACGALVTVVSPVLCPAMERLAAASKVRVERRQVGPEDVAGAFIVIAATDDAEVNRWVADLARRERALVNAVDQPEQCVFSAPAVLRRGVMSVAISTGGASPALAARIRDELEEIIGPEWGVIMQCLAVWRSRLRARYPDDAGTRRRLMLEVATMDVASLVRSQGRGGLEARLDALLAPGDPVRGGS
jgi:precorrin-2 dehydrogenase/sirohydrochlorin ferrochelatase